jgi:hypothetical protein
MQDNKADLVLNGDTLTRQSFGQGSAGQSYTLARAGGRLSKYVKQSTTLAAIKNVKISAGFNSSPGVFQNIEMYWDDVAAQFMKSGTNNCGPSGCQLTPVNPATAIDNASWASVTGGIFGYSQTLSGEVRIGDLTALSGAVAGLSVRNADCSLLLGRVRGSGVDDRVFHRSNEQPHAVDRRYGERTVQSARRDKPRSI